MDSISVPVPPPFRRARNYHQENRSRIYWSISKLKKRRNALSAAIHFASQRRLLGLLYFPLAGELYLRSFSFLCGKVENKKHGARVTIVGPGHSYIIEFRSSSTTDVSNKIRKKGPQVVLLQRCIKMHFTQFSNIPIQVE